MKQLLISLVMFLALSMNTEAVAQKHRHTPRTEQADSTNGLQSTVYGSQNNQDAIEAFSDTTAVAEDAEDDSYITHRRSSTYSSSDVQDLKEVMDAFGGAFGGWVAVSIIAIVILFLLAPLLIIIAIFYFVNRNRREKYKLAQMAMQNGQPIPDELLKEKQADWDRNDYHSGLRQMFTGVGLAIFLGLAAGKVGFGIGALVFFIGLGKWYIAKKSGAIGNDAPMNNSSDNNINSNIKEYD